MIDQMLLERYVASRAFLEALGAPEGSAVTLSDRKSVV